MRTPLVSVVITCFNLREWIGEALESVLHQTCDPECLEIIVVDCGSTDDSATVVKSLLNATTIRSRLIVKDNGGASRARNSGLQCATGEWIQFLDGEDLLHPRKIERQLAAATCLGPEYAIVYSDWQRLRWQQRKWTTDPDVASPRIGKDLLADLLRTENFIQVGSQLVRRSWLERVSGFDERQWLIEDVNLLIRLAMAGGRFYRAPSERPLFFYRQREGSLSRSNTRDFVEACIRNVCVVEEHWREQDSLTTERVELLASLYCQAARYFAANDKKRFDE